MNDQLKTLEYAQRSAIELAIAFGPKLLVALLIMAAGFFVGRWVARLSGSMLTKLGLDETLRLVLTRVVHLAVIGLFGIMALQNLGVQLLPLLAGLGVAGAGVALAMQGVLGNLAAGLTIIFTRPFLVGEYISIAKEEGTVEEIRLFNTVLSHADGRRSKPQDRGRNSAQLRHGAPAQRGGGCGLRHPDGASAESGAPGPGRQCADPGRAGTGGGGREFGRVNRANRAAALGQGGRFQRRIKQRHDGSTGEFPRPWHCHASTTTRIAHVAGSLTGLQLSARLAKRSCRVQDHWQGRR